MCIRDRAQGKRLLEEQFVPAFNQVLEMAGDSTSDRSMILRVRGAFENQVYHKYVSLMSQGRALEGLTPYLNGITLADICPDPNLMRARRSKHEREHTSTTNRTNTSRAAAALRASQFTEAQHGR